VNSIDRNMPEESRCDLSGPEAIERIQSIIEASPNCFFCTSDPDGSSKSERPMNVRKADDDGVLWFLSAADSHKNAELARDPRVRLYFQGSKHSDFLALDGKATVSTDRTKIEVLWEPNLKTWFTGGLDDPRITVIRFETESGYYWDNKQGSAVAGIKMLIGAALGKTMDDSVHGTLNV